MKFHLILTMQMITIRKNAFHSPVTRLKDQNDEFELKGTTQLRVVGEL